MNPWLLFLQLYHRIFFWGQIFRTDRLDLATTVDNWLFLFGSLLVCQEDTSVVNYTFSI